MNRKAPPLLIAAGLLFWGWQSGLLLAGALLGLVLEAGRWAPVRWEFSYEDFRRARTFCLLLCLAALVYSFSNNQGPTDFLNLFRDPSLFAQRNAGAASARTMAAMLRWTPMILFLLIATQVFDSRGAVPLEVLSPGPRRRAERSAKPPASAAEPQHIDLLYPYFVVCLFAASVHASEDTSFYWGFSALTVWALWPLRSKRFALPLWAASLAVAVGLGYAGQHGLGRLQGWLANYNPRWFSHSVRGGGDPFRSKTALGRVGRLKGSGRIVARMELVVGPAPQLLREAAYRTYKSQTWYSESSTNDFTFVPAETNKTSWVLLPGKTNTAIVNLAASIPGGRGLLPLPMGCGRLENLYAFTPPQRNDLGTVLLADAPGLVVFDAFYGSGAAVDSAPNANMDLAVTPREAPAIEATVAAFHLAGSDREQTLRRVSQFFEQNFQYRSWLGPNRNLGTNDTPLSVFLLRDHAGHCEYFATATVLLLRQLNIPARYAVGYSVHETSGSGYLVRQRDAHAWCLVWNDTAQRWDDFDTTPASWLDAEAKRASPLEFLSDVWWRFTFELAKLRWGQTQLRVYLLWGIAPVLGVLLYQIIFRRRRRLAAAARSAPTAVWPGLDSEFYQVERHLAARGVGRQPGEPLSNWLRRAARDPSLLPMRDPLQQLLTLHYRYRFDPLGLTQADRRALQLQAETCLASIGAAMPHARNLRRRT
jgi:transglutaminase-like putative cysteine protease